MDTPKEIVWWRLVFGEMIKGDQWTSGMKNSGIDISTFAKAFGVVSLVIESTMTRRSHDWENNTVDKQPDRIRRPLKGIGRT